MDIFNSNKKLEELTIFGIDWGVFLRHDIEGPISPFMYLQDENEQNIRVLMAEGDPLEFAKKVLEKEEKPFRQFIVGFEGYLRDDNNNRADAIIVHGFDVRQNKGVSIGQVFTPKENGAFKKIGRMTFLGQPDLILPLQPEENPDYSTEEPGFTAMAVSDKENGLTNYIAVITHENPSVIATTVKMFLRSKFTSDDAGKLSGDFEIQIPDNCVKHEEFLTFLLKNAISEEVSEENVKKWSENYSRPVTVRAKYNGRIIVDTKPGNNTSETISESDESDLSKYSVSDLDAKFAEILNIPNARTNIEALTRMSELLKEYKRRNIETPDKRNTNNPPEKAGKKWWQFWK